MVIALLALFGAGHRLFRVDYLSTLLNAVNQTLHLSHTVSRSEAGAVGAVHLVGKVTVDLAVAAASVASVASDARGARVLGAIVLKDDRTTPIEARFVDWGADPTNTHDRKEISRSCNRD